MNTFRIPFLVATDLLVLAMLIALLSGCATAPQLQYRNGDFVSHMAAVEADARVAVAHNDDAQRAPAAQSTSNSART
jgi:uncharacterized lipoprotein YajG